MIRCPSLFSAYVAVAQRQCLVAGWWWRELRAAAAAAAAATGADFNLALVGWAVIASTLTRGRVCAGRVWPTGPAIAINSGRSSRGDLKRIGPEVRSSDRRRRLNGRLIRQKLIEFRLLDRRSPNPSHPHLSFSTGSVSGEPQSTLDVWQQPALL